MKARMVLILMIGTSLSLLFVLGAAAQSNGVHVVQPLNAPAYGAIQVRTAWEMGFSASGRLESMITAPGQIYLPMVKRGTPLCRLAPTLLTPTDGSQMDTLIPVLTYIQNNLPISSTLMTIADNPDFNSPIVYSISGIGGGEKSIELFDNLLPATQYYWHVQDKCGSIYSPDSAVFSFTTSADGVILPAPSLISPANGTVDLGYTITTTWSSVPGAVGYQLWLLKENGGGTLIFVTGTSYMIDWPDPNTAYNWYVNAYNSYAYGDSSEVWHFTTGSFNAKQNEGTGWIAEGEYKLVNRR